MLRGFLSLNATFTDHTLKENIAYEGQVYYARF